MKKLQLRNLPHHQNLLYLMVYVNLCLGYVKLILFNLQGLENVLGRFPEGRLALINKRKLSNDLRQKIAKVVINELLSSSHYKNGKYE